MDLQKVKRQNRNRRHAKVRKVVIGTAQRPRLSVFRSGKHIYAQLIDDSTGRTLVAASSRNFGKKDKKVNLAFEVGKLVAQKALEKKLKQVVFDRGGFAYHGRVKALADGAREGGLEF